MREPREKETRELGEAQARAAQTDKATKFFPRNEVGGVINDPDAARRAVADLRAAGFEDPEILVLHGEEGIRFIDPSGEAHGLVGRLVRGLQAVGIEREHTERHVAELRAGHSLVLVASADKAAADRIREILEAHGGHLIYHYGTWSSSELVP